jgi:hypothetical protein
MTVADIPNDRVALNRSDKEAAWIPLTRSP